MNAKQAEQLTGISRRNLRFYEDQGLIHPSRNPGNDYRDYSDADIETLKKIRALRMLDVTIEDIGALLKEEKTLKQVMVAQEEKLKQRQQELQTAIRFCKELQTGNPDPSELLSRMDQPEVKKSLFQDWVRDYLAVAQAEGQKRFLIFADKPVATAREFTDALLTYGQESGRNLVITKEGLMPEFTLDGVPYTAQRLCYYDDPNCPSDTIACEAVDPQALEAPVEGPKARVMGFIHHWWWALPLLILEVIYNVRTGAPALRSLLIVVIALICIFGADWYFFTSHKEQN